MRCNNCELESELDSNYCRKCGMPMKVPSKGPAEEPKRPDKSANPRSTSELKGVDFPNKTAAKRVVPISGGDEGPAGRQLNRKLQTMFVFIVILGALQVVAIVAVVVWMRRPATQHEQARVDVQTSTAAPNVAQQEKQAQEKQAQEQQSQEAAQEEAARVEAKDTLEELKESSAQEAQTVEKLKNEEARIQRRINEKKRKLKELNDQLAVAVGELNGVRSEIAQANVSLRELKAELKATVARASGTRRKPLVPVAQTARKRAAVAQLQQKVKGLKGVETQKQRRVKELRIQIAGISNADEEGRNRRTRRKTGRPIAD